MKPGSGGHDGPGTAQLILVFNVDDGLLVLTVHLPGTETDLALSSSATARGGHAYQHHIHVKTLVGVKFFVAVELPGQGVQQLVQVRATPQELLHLYVGRTKRMGEPMRLYGEVEEIVRAGVVSNLGPDGGV